MNKNAVPVVLALIGLVIGGLYVPFEFVGLHYMPIWETIGEQRSIFGTTWDHASWGRYIFQLAGGAAVGLVIGYLGVIANKSQK